MARLILIPSLLCAAALLSACQHTKPLQKTATPAATTAAAPAPAQAAQAAQTQSAPVVEFRLAQTTAAKNLTEVRLANTSIWVLPQPVLTRSDLSGVQAVKNKQGRAFVHFAFNPAGAKKLSTITAQNKGKLLVLSVNRQLVAMPRIDGPITAGVLNVPMESEQRAVNVSNAVIGKKAPTAK